MVHGAVPVSLYLDRPELEATAARLEADIAARRAEEDAYFREAKASGMPVAGDYWHARWQAEQKLRVVRALLAA